MNNENNNYGDIAKLEIEIHDAVAQGVNVKEAVEHITLKAMKADRLDLESLRRIIVAAMQGAQEGASHQLEHAKDQSQTAQAQIRDAVTGLDSALARFVQASKLAVEEAAGRTQKFSDTELSRTQADLKSLESMFVDTLQDTATSAKGAMADTLSDLVNHARNNGTVVGEQLKQTLVTLAQQTASVGQAQLEVGAKLAHVTADLIGKIADGVLSGMANQEKPKEPPIDS
jgi:hypothetical protein